MRYRVVAMRPEHLEAVHRIEVRSYARPWTREGLEQELTRPRVALCRVALGPETAPAGREVLGYLFAWHVGQEIGLNNLAVHPDHRGRGIGRALLEDLVREATASGCRRIALEVRAENRAARALYRSAGFRQVGLRPRYYEPEGEDALLLALVLGHEG